MYDFSVDHSSIKKEDILNIHQYLTIKNNMFGFIEKCLLDYWLVYLMPLTIQNVSLRNQKCTTQPSFINLHPNEYTQGLHYYPFAVNLARCAGSCSTQVSENFLRSPLIDYFVFCQINLVQFYNQIYCCQKILSFQIVER